jgi:RHS repeat-associated protein
MISIPLHSTTNSYHLGNNDEVVDAKGVVQQVTNYYPFGAPYADASATLNTSLQAYKYNGKEFDNMHGLNTYDYGARQYNPVTARWDRMDPLCEADYGVSPYCVNNPVRFIDPDGQKPTKKEAAMIADDVYNASSGTLSGGWRRVATKSGAILNDEKSGLKSAVYGRWDAKQKKYTEFVYATAGTDFTSMEDWSNNIDQLSGDSEQYGQSIKNAKLLNGYFKNSELTFVGHSLGGGLASANSLATGRDAITFNAAGLSDGTKTKHNLTNTRGRIDSYVVKGEALSNAQGMICLKAERIIQTIKVPIYFDITAKATSTDIALSLWKHTMGCVKYIFNK